MPSPVKNGHTVSEPAEASLSCLWYSKANQGLLTDVRDQCNKPAWERNSRDDENLSLKYSKIPTDFNASGSYPMTPRHGRKTKPPYQTSVKGNPQITRSENAVIY